MQIFLQLIYSGIALGMIYGVIAFGYQLTFATSGTLNFGQGESLMLGALVGLSLVGTIHGVERGVKTHRYGACDCLGWSLAFMAWNEGLKPFAREPAAVWVGMGSKRREAPHSDAIHCLDSVGRTPCAARG